MAKRLAFLITLVLILQFAFPGFAKSAGEDIVEVKELNFVFVHGAAGNACGVQFLSDSIVARLPKYISDYEQENPGIKVRFDTLNRCYPNDVSVETWANNIAESIDKYLSGKGTVILVGHSMGGKAAIYAVAKNVGNIADRVALVVTINTPINSLEGYQVTGGGSMLDYCRARWLLTSDRGVCASVNSYDSSEDGRWVGENKHWLALISGENAPQSPQCNYGGIDVYPRDMDDGALPISSQYCEGADVVYYGGQAHSSFQSSSEVAQSLAKEILQYIFGGTVACSVFASSGSFEHKSGGLIGADSWRDIVGDALAGDGILRHWNQSYIKWQEWEDIIERPLPTYEKYQRSRYEISLVKSSAVFTNIEEVRWLEPDNPEDFRLYLRTKAAPRNSIQVDWKIYRQVLLPADAERDRYEIAMVASTPLTGIGNASWANDNPRDLRIQVWSHAERPFHWFEAEWKVYYKENRQRKVIDEIPALPGVVSIR